MADQPDSIYVLDRDLTREQLIDALEATPGRLRAILAGRDAVTLTRKAAPDDWSAIETVRHFRDAVQVYGMRFKWMILQDDPFLPNYDENAWAENSPDGPDDVLRLIDEIAAFRSETSRLLRALTDDGWARTGRHEISGPVHLEPYVRHQLAHEEMHLAQLEQALP
jgi:hypothetical protein